ncbi:MAG: sensor domain-containing diguanylate cyclase [Proteobacteria bacterium]|nr:sensor domain-containing diguanylate cyclase [Pseudomonadota bacterium]MBU1585521.1 sensor domain-containing diguanylate cyclase [Pseudomonadota bacterium]MBU2453891.1 sensor domain-containing diguanylate cyclase [Pseudomonadota bacterium]MBU2630281.1 sensor domain-containing diguanylate cyclase [Pseudomonadota bacterium]
MGPEIYRDLLENLYDGVYYVNKTQNITIWNKSAEKITGYSKNEVRGFRCSDNILRHINDQGDELCIKGCPLGRTLRDGKIRDADVYLHHKNGHRVPVSIRVAPILDKEKQIIGAVEIFSDNSKQMTILKELEILRKEVFTDKLTQVGNRKFAEFNLATRFSEMKAYDIPFGVLFFDIDNFKKINDAYGHNTGDMVLKMVSKTILNILRSLDAICRWGGDEFVVIIPNVDLNTLKIIAEKIRMFIEKTWLKTKDAILRITISIGGTMALEADSIDALIQKADSLMYDSKKNGRNAISIA